MSQLLVKVSDSHDQNSYESLESYCKRLGKRNNSLLYKLENYLGKKLMSDDELIEIRDLVLTMSADISKLSTLIVVGDEDEGL
ncbi:hypothetical protein P4V41_07175 [Fictibacillus nanhaiensis]|uniref:hypothetical protein n=1 Tax=Fictibacillus nanhaiensis TaxID=742169 RepID=UPI002E1E508B|nr:hypothetical protein [Fictibacillus nanhaiensis]